MSSGESTNDTWFAARITGPRSGTCSRPSMSSRQPRLSNLVDGLQGAVGGLALRPLGSGERIRDHRRATRGGGRSASACVAHRVAVCHERHPSVSRMGVQPARGDSPSALRRRSRRQRCVSTGRAVSASSEIAPLASFHGSRVSAPSQGPAAAACRWCCGAARRRRRRPAGPCGAREARRPRGGGRRRRRAPAGGGDHVRGQALPELVVGHADDGGVQRRRDGRRAGSSTSRGNTFSPPLTIMSSARPVTNSRPSASKWPTSPVDISPPIRSLVPPPV